MWISDCTLDPRWMPGKYECKKRKHENFVNDNSENKECHI